jgi:hypothetical protein
MISLDMSVEYSNDNDNNKQVNPNKPDNNKNVEKRKLRLTRVKSCENQDEVCEENINNDNVSSVGSSAESINQSHKGSSESLEPPEQTNTVIEVDKQQTKQHLKARPKPKKILR